ncbi:hypothetical protein GTR04_6277 [Trichophyton interdigitale]|nr:hypothetical protein GTR04_6277 [Trichophyton interdigitale]
MAHGSDQPIDEGEELETSREGSRESSRSEDEDNSGSLPPEPEEASDSNFDIDSESEATSTDTSESEPLIQTWRRTNFRKRSSVPRIKRRSSSVEDHHHKRKHSRTLWRSYAPLSGRAGAGIVVASRDVFRAVCLVLLHHPTVP